MGSPYEKLNSFVLHVNQELAKGNAQTIHKLAAKIEDEIEQQEMLQTESSLGRGKAASSWSTCVLGMVNDFQARSRYSHGFMQGILS